MRYLQGTKNLGLVYKRNENNNVCLTGYSDADFANGKDGKSISGYCSALGECTVFCSSKKQSTVAQSSAESETIAASYAAKELSWLRKLLDDMMTDVNRNLLLNADNQVSIALAKNQGNQFRSKHIRVKHLLVQELVEEGIMKLKY